MVQVLQYNDVGKGINSTYRKGEFEMATSTFDRDLVLTDVESVIKLMAIEEMEPPSEPFSKHPYTDEDRKRGEELFRAWLSRSRH